MSSYANGTERVTKSHYEDKPFCSIVPITMTSKNVMTCCEVLPGVPFKLRRSSILNKTNNSLKTTHWLCTNFGSFFYRMIIVWKKC